MDSGVAAIVVTLTGIFGGLAAWLIGTVVFAAFVSGIAFTTIGVYLVSEAF